jgi:hypothetical protein
VFHFDSDFAVAILSRNWWWNLLSSNEFQVTQVR